jgi:prevent-host-death family protein
MKTEISKSKFKEKALEFFRKVQQTGQPVIITDHGKPALEVRRYRNREPLENLKGSVIEYRDPTRPVAEEDWENA